jgi:glyoxylase-like metal-dependent hydrolase (beta-lactamase superfamily II)
MALAAFQGPGAAPLTLEPLQPGVYLAKGGAGANAGVIVGKKEVVVIDAKMTGDSATAMLAEIAKVTPNPLKYVVLTHSDGDHVNGLAGFPKGVAIVAHPSSRSDMEEAFKSTPALQPYLPAETTAGKTLPLDGVRVELLHFGPAHTSGDLVVFLPQQRIAFTGDLLFIGRDPLIHLHKRGTFLGLVATLNKLLALDADTFVSGHAAPVTKTEIKGLLASLEERQAKVKALVDQGKSLAEVKKEFGIADTPQRRPGLIDAIYRDLTEKR